jgi:hypothetical protein
MTQVIFTRFSGGRSYYESAEVKKTQLVASAKLAYGMHPRVQ